MKRLYKSTMNRMICGVCGGIAEYFNLDPSLIRLVAVLIACVSFGTGLLAYIVMAIILPNDIEIK
ncbi:MAG: PspC domain-containing protein [Clostridia bacterium]|nr:PspC domain-containing protein [Clostridia bacterium]